MTVIKADAAGDLWTQLLSHIVQRGDAVSPRGLSCAELIGVTLRLGNSSRNLFDNKVRNLQYRFAVAEWLWIWFGHDDVATIARYNPKIVQFSDDGESFSGAYGPRVKGQWPLVVQKLKQDQSSRQAVITIFSQPTGKTKDVPCTISLQFLLRRDRLHTIATMRSSDVWLGLPYDIFNFTMLANILAAQLGVELGPFIMQLGSSHLYETNYEKAGHVLEGGGYKGGGYTYEITSPKLTQEPPQYLHDILVDQKRILASSPLEYTRYAGVLLSPDNETAREILCRS